MQSVEDGKGEAETYLSQQLNSILGICGDSSTNKISHCDHIVLLRNELAKGNILLNSWQIHSKNIPMTTAKTQLDDELKYP